MALAETEKGELVPEDRLLHPRLLRSQKVAALTHLEFRVWTVRKLIADDFGVLPWVPAMLQAATPPLAREPAKAIDAALGRIAASGLLLAFEIDGQRYLCDPRWQEFQKVRYPRRTLHPCPPAELFPEFDRETTALFREFHRDFPAALRKASRKVSGISPGPARAGARETANGIRLTADGSEGGPGGGAPAAVEDLAAGAGKWGPAMREVFTRYEALFMAAYEGARPQITRGKDPALVKQLLVRHGQARVLELLEVFFRSEDPFIRQAGHSLGVLSSCWNKLAAEARRPRGGRDPRRITEAWKNQPEGPVEL
jgi:hypothetical protein